MLQMSQHITTLLQIHKTTPTTHTHDNTQNSTHCTQQQLYNERDRQHAQKCIDKQQLTIHLLKCTIYLFSRRTQTEKTAVFSAYMPFNDTCLNT